MDLRWLYIKRLSVSAIRGLSTSPMQTARTRNVRRRFGPCVTAKDREPNATETCGANATQNERTGEGSPCSSSGGQPFHRAHARPPDRSLGAGSRLCAPATSSWPKPSGASQLMSGTSAGHSGAATGASPCARTWGGLRPCVRVCVRLPCQRPTAHSCRAVHRRRSSRPTATPPRT